jgi:hypothetical protein
MEWRAAMESLSPSTINVRLSGVRKLVGEARRNNMIGSEEAASLTDIPNIRQKGTRLGNWLTREKAKELLAVPDRSTLKGDYVILALLVGCAYQRTWGGLAASRWGLRLTVWTQSTLSSGFSEPIGVAVDGSGNVFVADFGNSAVKEILVAGAYTLKRVR